MKKGFESISWTSNQTPTSPTVGAVTYKPVESRNFKFKSGEDLAVELASKIKYLMLTSEIDATNYWFFTGIAPTEIYFTKE